MKYCEVMQNWEAICRLVRTTYKLANEALDSGVYDDNSGEACDLRAVWDLCNQFDAVIATEE